VIRVLLVDDQELVRAGFRIILNSEPGIEVVGEAASGEAAVELARALQPDVICMDVQMPGVDGIEATRMLAADSTVAAGILILTTFNRDDYLFDALQAGASGFLLKSSSPEQLVEAVQVIARGDALLSPAVTGRVIQQFARPVSTATMPEGLTERETDVLRLIARGLANAEIAAELYVGEATVKTHVSNLFVKLGVRDRVQAVVFAYENGFAVPGSSPP
jgi:DNA-binding NarL/FixJ family response regulator